MYKTVCRMVGKLTWALVCCAVLYCAVQAGGRGSKGTKRRALQRFGLSGEDVDAPVDGVFRAVPADTVYLAENQSSVAQLQDGRWVASLNLGGEMYQAFFVQQSDATEALNAAGYAVAS